MGALIEWFCLGILALCLVEMREGVQALCHLWVVGTEDLLTNRQGALKEWLCLCVLALILVERREDVQARCNSEGVRNWFLLGNIKRLFCQHNRLIILFFLIK